MWKGRVRGGGGVGVRRGGVGGGVLNQTTLNSLSTITEQARHVNPYRT